MINRMCLLAREWEEHYPGELKERRFGEGEGDLFKALQ